MSCLSKHEHVADSFSCQGIMNEFQTPYKLSNKI